MPVRTPKRRTSPRRNTTTAPKRRSKKNATPPVIWIGLGVILGISLTYSVQTIRSLPFMQNWHPSKNDNDEKTPSTEISDAADFVFEYPDKLTEEVPIYEYQIPKPKIEKKPSSNSLKTSIPQKDVPVDMIIQVGSFRNFQDADRMKARLAFIGIQAGIQRVRLDRNAQWHRVRITRFKNLSDFAQTRKRLKENNINYFVFKVKS